MHIIGFKREYGERKPVYSTCKLSRFINRARRRKLVGAPAWGTV